MSFNNSVKMFCLSLLVTIPVFAAPRLHCSAPKYDFGTRISGGSITNEFILFNKGNEPIEISKIKDCCGVKSSIQSLEIAPGSSAVCTSIFTTRNRYGKQTKQILIASNNPKKPYYELKLVGTLQRPVEFKPRFLKLTNLLPDSEIDHTISATNILKKSITLDSVKSTIPGIHAEVVCRADMVEDLPAATGYGPAPKTVPALQEDRPRSWTIQLSSTGPLPVGKLKGRIQLNFSSGQVIVPVFGTVKPIIQAVPDRIQLSSTARKPVSRLIMLRGDRPFSISSTKLINADGEVKANKITDGKHQLSLTIDPASIKPGAKLLIKTSGPSQSAIEIPLLAK